MGDIYTNPPQSRNEALVRAIIDGTEYTDPPQSRNEAILKSIIDNSEYTAAPQSRMEDLLLELKDAISGGSVVPLRLKMTFNNDTPANADGVIYLETSGSEYDGNYDIYWGDANGVMSNYAKIGTININVSDEKPMGYIKLMEYNAIPKYATRVCAVKNNAIATSFYIPEAKLWAAGNYGEHLYSFGALSDVHVQYPTGHDDTRVAMTYLNEREGVDAICIAGDLTSDGSVAHMEEWKTDRDTWADNTPVYSCPGNHEAYNASSIMKTAPTTIREYLDSDYSESTGDPYFYKIINNDVFVFVPIYEGLTASQSAVMFSTESLEWLESVLEQYRNQRVFLFAHVPPHARFLKYSGFGTGNLAYSYDIWGYSDATTNKMTFLSLLEHYKNVIWFSGHSHIKYEYQNLWDYLNVYQYKNGARFVHISSITVPRDIVDGSVTDYIYAESEGAVVDVYTNCIRVRNRNFVREKFYGLCEYFIDTTPVTIPPAAKTVVSISAVKTKTAYYTDETLSTADITVTATYSDTSTDDVSSECVFDTSNVTLNVAGTYTIGISYTYEGDTVTTSLQVTSEARPVSMVVMLDATFAGEFSAANQILPKDAITANNNKTELSGTTKGFALCRNSAILNKPLYYRLLSDTGISYSDKVGFLGAASATTGTFTTSFTDYSLDATEWTPLMQSHDPTQQIVVSDPNDRVWIQCKASSSSTATFPVTVNARIQIGYVNT